MGSMVFLNVFLFKQFPKTFKEETWTVGREIGWTLINILVISVGVALYSHLRGIVSLSPGQFILFVGYVFAMLAVMGWNPTALPGVASPL